ncbi:MAG: DNA-directed RNA polymerase subunit omega [Armatimonadetes bacterium]|nr:DNA-directed RNA polymerase subunit omega [Armatimonadota bacterium]
MRPFPIEELVDRVGSRFTVVVAAAKRAKQIKDGAPPLINLPTRNALTIALHEIAAGLIQIGDAPPEPEPDGEGPVAEEIGDLAAPEVVEALLARGDDVEDVEDEDIVEDTDDEDEAAEEEDLSEDLEEEEEELEDEELEDSDADEDLEAGDEE